MGQPYRFNPNILRNLNRIDWEFPGGKSPFKVFRACEICQKKKTL